MPIRRHPRVCRAPVATHQTLISKVKFNQQFFFQIEKKKQKLKKNNYLRREKELRGLDLRTLRVYIGAKR